MKIHLRIKDKVIPATLIPSNTTDDFLRLLPLQLKLEDYAHKEKISYLPKKLSTKDAPKGSKPSIGDITYYAPWGNLAILGKIESDVEILNTSESLEIRIEQIE